MMRRKCAIAAMLAFVSGVVVISVRLMLHRMHHRDRRCRSARLDRERSSAGGRHPARRHKRAQEKRAGEREEKRQARLAAHQGRTSER
jgi:hypothetical protein